MEPPHIAMAFEKLENSVVMSLSAPGAYKGFNIVPEAINQGPYPTCVFHSHAKGGQMSVHRAYADVGRDCDIVMSAESMIRDILVLNKMSSQDVWLRKPLADRFFDRISTASWVLTNGGVDATGDQFCDPVRIAVSDVRFLGEHVSFDTLSSLLDEGKPILAVMIAGPDFWAVEQGDIYTCVSTAKFDSLGNLQKPHEYHMVILTGHGEAEISCRKILGFLNSHGKLFGEEGSGWLYHSEVFYFFCIESEFPPIVKPAPSPRPDPPTRTRSYIDKPKWRPEGKFVVNRTYNKPTEGTARSWRSKMDGNTLNVTKGRNIRALIENEMRFTFPDNRMNPKESKDHIREGIKLAIRSVLKSLKGMTRAIDSPECVAQVILRASHDQPKIAELISDAFRLVGDAGMVIPTEGSNHPSEVKPVVGLRLKRGYTTPYFITNQKTRQCELKNPLILVCAKYFTKRHAEEVWKIAFQNKRSLLIVTDQIDSEALTFLADNKLYSNFKVCVVKAYGSGQIEQLNLEAVATFTGAKVLRDMDDIKLIHLQMLGNSHWVTVTSSACVILGDSASIETTAQQLVEKAVQTSVYRKEMIEKSVSDLLCTFALLKLGGSSTEVVVSQKEIVTSALITIESALKAGLVPGDGFALLYATKYLEELHTEHPDGKFGVQIVQNALMQPVHTRLSTMGLDATAQMDSLLEKNDVSQGYNSTGSLVDLWEAGVTEPCELMLDALRSAQIGACRILQDVNYSRVVLPLAEVLPGRDLRRSAISR